MDREAFRYGRSSRPNKPVTVLMDGSGLERVSGLRPPADPFHNRVWNLAAGSGWAEAIFGLVFDLKADGKTP